MYEMTFHDIITSFHETCEERVIEKNETEKEKEEKKKKTTSQPPNRRGLITM